MAYRTRDGEDGLGAAKVIDTDPKDPARIPHYHHLDHAITDHFTVHGRGQRPPCVPP